MSQDDSSQWDRGALIRYWLIRFVEEQPFVPFVIQLEGGFELAVPSREVIIYEPGVLVVSVFDREDRRHVVPVERIVSLVRQSQS